MQNSHGKDCTSVTRIKLRLILVTLVQSFPCEFCIKILIYLKYNVLFFVERHNGYPADGRHVTNLDASQLRGGMFDENFVLSSRVRTGRSIRGFALPPWCDRKHRRAVEKVSVAALSK